MKRTLFLLIILLGAKVSPAQTSLTLQGAVEMAQGRSLAARVARHTFLYNEWGYKNYRARRLPSFTLESTPFEYYSDIVQRYSYTENRDIYRSQKYGYSYARLVAQQNVDFLGGVLYADSRLNYYRTYGDNSSTQFSTSPLRVGYSQSLLGYNAFKWERRLEPLKYKTAKKSELYALETAAAEAVSRFFALAQTEAESQLADENSRICDTLYRMGLVRDELQAISKADLLTLKLECATAENTRLELLQRRSVENLSLARFLTLPDTATLLPDVSATLPELAIPVDMALQRLHENSPEILAARQAVVQNRQEVSKTGRQRFFEASVSASIGLNQIADNFHAAYRDPLRQEVVQLSLTLPLVDFGQRRSLHRQAKEALEVANLNAEQKQQSLDEELLAAIGTLPLQRQIVLNAAEAADLALLSYRQTAERFRVGKADMSGFSLAISRRRAALENYYTALKTYWLTYYSVRRLTLYDFEKKCAVGKE